jgi:glutamate mutase epsilon subunit
MNHKLIYGGLFTGLLVALIVGGSFFNDSALSFLKEREDFLEELRSNDFETKLAEGIAQVGAVDQRCRSTKSVLTDEEKKTLERSEGGSEAIANYVAASDTYLKVGQENKLPGLVDLLPFYKNRYERFMAVLPDKIRTIKERAETLSQAVRSSRIDCAVVPPK